VTITKAGIHRGGRERLPLLAVALAVLPALAGCSGFSSFSSPVASTPPPQYSPTAAAAPSQQPYRTAAAPTASPPAAPSTQRSSAGQTSAFQGMYQDPSTDSTRRPPDSLAPYPSVSLVDLFRSDGAAAAQDGVPHPPPTYTPAGQQVAVAPSQRAAQTPVDASNTGAYPSQSLFDLFKSDSTQPAQTGVPRPPPTYTPSSQQAAASPPPAAPAPVDASNTGAYPSQSITDLFKRDSSGQ
jgi:hypothetical protein